VGQYGGADIITHTIPDSVTEEAVTRPSQTQPELHNSNCYWWRLYKTSLTFLSKAVHPRTWYTETLYARTTLTFIWWPW